MGKLKDHPFHMVEKTMWPMMVSVGMLGLMIGLMFSEGIEMMLGGSMMVISSSLWWSDCSSEGNSEYTSEVSKGLKLGFMLFMLSEVMLFMSMLWAYIHVSLMPSVEMFNSWEGTGIDALELPLLNTVLLLSSGCSITLAHNKLIKGDSSGVKVGMILTVLLGTMFMMCQGMEYKYSPMSMSDGMVGSVFYVSTGTHGLHMMVGTMFIMIQTLNSGMSSENHLGIEMSMMYWHFVDMVWMMLYVMMY